MVNVSRNAETSRGVAGLLHFTPLRASEPFYDVESLWFPERIPVCLCHSFIPFSTPETRGKGPETGAKIGQEDLESQRPGGETQGVGVKGSSRVKRIQDIREKGWGSLETGEGLFRN